MAVLVSPSEVVDRISQTFDEPTTRHFYAGYGYKGHNGVDIAFRQSVIRAVAAGSVTVAGFDAGGYGTWAEVSHPWGKTRYAHGVRGTLKVQAAHTVQAGTPLFEGDSTGNSDGPHLHFEIRVPGYPQLHVPGYRNCIDPLPYLPKDIGGGGLEIGEVAIEDEFSRLQKQLELVIKDRNFNRVLKGTFEWAAQELLDVQLAANVNAAMDEAQRARVENVRVEVERARGNL
jgi:hypothetical protein